MANLASVRSPLADGVHVFHGDDGRVLLTILSDGEKSLKIREFVIADVLPGALEDALSEDERKTRNRHDGEEAILRRRV